MEIVVCPPDGEHKRLRVLIDTGAQINVVKRGLFPESSLQPARHPIMLTLADGQPFWGGDVELVANLMFGKTVDGKVVPWKSKARFYVGVIRADIILGLPWLAKNGLDVLTRDGCLGERKGCKTFLISDCPEELENSHEEPQEIDTLPSHMVGCIPPKRIGWASRQKGTRPPESHRAMASVAMIGAGQGSPDCDSILPQSSKKPHEHCVGEKPPSHGLAQPCSTVNDFGGLMACIQENKRQLFEKELDGFLEAYVQTEKIPHAPYPVPSDDDHLEDDLTVVEKWEMERQCQKIAPTGNVAGIYVSTSGKLECKLAQQLREKSLAEFADTVFRPQIYPDPPERVPGGIHTIKLKEGAQPVYQHPFNLAGERRKAMEDIVQQWIDVGKIERPTKNEGWGAPVFPIPKKNGDFRGISDHRGLNQRVLDRKSVV